MGYRSGEQPCESKKVRIRRRPVLVGQPARSRRIGRGPEGMLWRRKMQSLALRLPKGREPVS